jgi:hypothetical protein
MPSEHAKALDVYVDLEPSTTELIPQIKARLEKSLNLKPKSKDPEDPTTTSIQLPSDFNIEKAKAKLELLAQGTSGQTALQSSTIQSFKRVLDEYRVDEDPKTLTEPKNKTLKTLSKYLLVLSLLLPLAEAGRQSQINIDVKRAEHTVSNPSVNKVIALFKNGGDVVKKSLNPKNLDTTLNNSKEDQELISKKSFVEKALKDPRILKDIEVIFASEGGYNNYANDYETNFGVTAPTLERLLPTLHKVDPKLFPLNTTVKNLTHRQAQYIYLWDYGYYVDRLNLNSPAAFGAIFDLKINYGREGVDMLRGEIEIQPGQSARFEKTKPHPIFDQAKLSDTVNSRVVAGGMITNSMRFRSLWVHGSAEHNLRPNPKQAEFLVGWQNRDMSILEKFDREADKEAEKQIQEWKQADLLSGLPTHKREVTLKGKKYKSTEVDIKYWNQLLDENGKIGLDENRRHCGAASAGMVINTIFSHEAPIATIGNGGSFFQRDIFFRSGNDLLGKNNGGLFYDTSNGRGNYSSPSGIKTALAKHGILSVFYEGRVDGKEVKLDLIESEIKSGRPMIIGYKMGRLSHYAVIKGVFKDESGKVAGLVLADPKGPTGQDGPSGDYSLKGADNPVLISQLDSYIVGTAILDPAAKKQLNQSNTKSLIEKLF